MPRYLVVVPYDSVRSIDAENPEEAAREGVEQISEVSPGWEVLVFEPKDAHRFKLDVRPFEDGS